MANPMRDALTKDVIQRNNKIVCSPSYEELYGFYSSVLNLYIEGVEFMNRDEIFEAVKKKVFMVTNKGVCDE